MPIAWFEQEVSLTKAFKILLLIRPNKKIFFLKSFVDALIYIHGQIFQVLFLCVL